MSNPRIAVVIGSTRDTRFADKPAQWIFDLARQRRDWEVELVDIRDFDLPLFNEAASNMWAPSKDPRAVAWQKKLAGFDGFIFVTAEYNRSVPGSLKNALDQAYKEWVRKPAAVVGYGATGGTRAAEHLRTIAIELQMVPIRHGVHILGADFMKVHPMGADAPISEIEANIMPGANAMLDDLDWWTRATMAARRETEKAAA
jgi:NAD(P)H-dependent FMN reductase